MKALGLLSGGLDSTLAVKLILEQGIEVIAVNLITPFCTCTRGGGCWASEQAEKLKIPLKRVYFGEEYLEVVKKPKHGYGSHLNPCVDCRIFMFKKAKKIMRETNSFFIFTGEVLGQRPASQRLDALRLIEKEAELKGLVFRPLSAKLLPATIPEKEGWVKRDAFLEIRGRSRKEQIRLAKNLGVASYPCPAGGCLLTDPSFSGRLKELLIYTPNPSISDLELLKVGRHFRIGLGKLVVGRDEVENERLNALSREGDLRLEVDGFMGPIAVGRGLLNEDDISKSAQITARYSDAPKDSRVKVNMRIVGAEAYRSLHVDPICNEELERFRRG